LAGIHLDPQRPAFKHVIIRPHPVGDLKWVRAEHESIYGPIRVAWTKDGGRFTLDVTVPVSATATVLVPAPKPESVIESGRRAATSPGVRFVRTEDGSTVFEIVSGIYRFITE
jgi:alpha-L-rhamnosidase